jgi:ABC-2 type transport system permease protein
MNKTLALAVKDLRVLPRVKAGLFFTFVWPIVVTVLFGYAFGGPASGQQSKVRIAVVDDDNTAASREFLKRIEESFELTAMSRAEAETAVRRGQRTGFIVITRGFGDASARMFYGNSREVEVGIDPSRRAEAAMIEGLLSKHAAVDMQRMFTDAKASSAMVDKALGEMQGAPPDVVAPTQRFLGELKMFMNAGAAGAAGATGAWEPLKISKTDVARVWEGPRNTFDITFPQGVIWGLIGCVMTFGISLVIERTHGTLVRLRMAPLTRAQILGGKALACFVSMMIVETLLLGVALAFGVRPSSYAILALAGVSSAVCFVGFMMLIASLGKTEQGASGAASALMMPLAMLGGAMVPQFVMPQWMQTIGMISPVRWSLMAIEGGVWRNFSLAEMALPCGILVSVGIACFALGTRGLREA